MPTENRSSTIEQHDHIEGIIDMVSAPFQREDRYIVIKRSDLALLSPVDSDLAHSYLEGVMSLMDEWNCPARECLVIESDWPEFEPTWAAIKARVTGQSVQKLHPEPVAWRGINELGEVVTDWIDGVPPSSMVDLCGNQASFAKIEQAYTHADPGEVERLRAGIRKHWRVVCNQRSRIIELRAQLATCNDARETLGAQLRASHAKLVERDALLREKDDVLMAAKEQFDRHGNSFPDRFDSRVFRWVADAVAASAEPSVPGKQGAPLGAVRAPEIQDLLDRAATAIGQYGDSLLGRGQREDSVDLLDLEREVRDLEQQFKGAFAQPST